MKAGLTIQELYSGAGFNQKEFCEALNRRFSEIGSSRKVSPKSIREWNAHRYPPRLTPEETLELCQLLRCNLYDLVMATRPNVRES
jgi:hypothetical protein